MRSILYLSSLLIMSSVASGQESTVDFWILRTSHDIATRLIETIDGKELPPAEISDRVSTLIQANKIQEIARFDEVVTRGVFSKKLGDGTISSKNGETNENLGLLFECETFTHTDRNTASIRGVIDFKEKTGRYEFLNLSTALSATFPTNQWNLVTSWADAEQATLLLIQVKSPLVAKNLTGLTDRNLKLRLELLQVRAEDLAHYRKSTAATRSKATLWLRERSTVLNSLFATFPAGHKIIHSNQAMAVSEQGAGSVQVSGLTAEMENTISADDTKTDLQLSVTWHSPKKKMSDGIPDYRFEFADTIPTGITQLCEPQTKPANNEVTVALLITPMIEQREIPSREVHSPRDPATVPDGITTYNYQVSPAFTRVLRNETGATNPQSTKQLLEKHGIIFVPGTSAIAGPEGGVFLTHSRVAHLAFIKLLTDLELEP